MQSSDVLSRPSRPPDLVLAYGEGEDRVADVRFGSPVGDDVSAARRVRSSALRAVCHGRSPLVIFLHGGFWRAAYDRTHTGPLADALADDGFVVCTPEYRKVGQAGGGWPGTFQDVAAAVEVLPRLGADATDGLTDGSQVIIAGHSAGGQLALWSASRQDSVAPAGRVAVVSLAGVCDLADACRQHLDN